MTRLLLVCAVLCAVAGIADAQAGGSGADPRPVMSMLLNVDRYPVAEGTRPELEPLK